MDHDIRAQMRKQVAVTGSALGVCRALAVEAKIRLREDRFLAIRRPIVVLWGKKRRKYGPHSRICSPAGQSPTGS
jgi:hypothetical protein